MTNKDEREQLFYERERHSLLRCLPIRLSYARLATNRVARSIATQFVANKS